MNAIEKEHHYRKKPKEILILDCVYLDGQRESLTKEIEQYKKELNELYIKFRKLSAASVSLRYTIGQLTQALVSASDASLLVGDR